MPNRDPYYDEVSRQDRGPLTARERQEWRLEAELGRARRRRQQVFRRWASWLGAAAAGTTVFIHLAEGWSKFVKWLLAR